MPGAVEPRHAPPARRGGGELARRILFAVVAAPIALWAVIAGGVPLAGLLAAVAGVGAWELYRMARASGIEPIEIVGIPVAAAWPVVAAGEPRGVFGAPPSLLAAVLLLTLTVAIWARGARGRPMSAVAVTLLGIAYTGGLLAFAEGIRNHRFVADERGGAALLLLPLLLTWANDIGGYVTGRLVGGPRLLPSVSPGKTIAGAIGGMAVTVTAGWLYVGWVLRPVAQLVMAPRNVLLFAVVVSAAGQIGDLVESLLKREAGVKDSSRIFPGHGGVLDRIDALLFALPVAYMLLDIPGFLLPAPVVGRP